jgi:hypothetical protein
MNADKEIGAPQARHEEKRRATGRGARDTRDASARIGLHRRFSFLICVHLRFHLASRPDVGEEL